MEFLEKKRPNWASEPSELGYIGTRCGALYGVVGTVFQNYGATSDDRKKAVDTIVRGTLLIMFGDQIAETVGWSKENLQKRSNMLVDTYGRLISSNRTLHNNLFHGFIEGDWKFCIRFETLMRGIASELKQMGK